jgi:hypothetical protein
MVVGNLVPKVSSYLHPASRYHAGGKKCIGSDVLHRVPYREGACSAAFFLTRFQGVFY